MSSQVRLFADDTAVGGLDDERVLQTDLDRLSVWEDQWDMEFNPSKCQVVRVTTPKKIMNSVYRYWKLSQVPGTWGLTSPVAYPEIPP